MELHYSLQYSVAVGFGLDLAEQINFFLEVWVAWFHGKLNLFGL